jgi:hypothetical protein
MVQARESIRAGITAYLLNGETLEHAQAIAGHESPRTTKLYHRKSDELLSMRSSVSEFSDFAAHRFRVAKTA